MSSKVIHVVGAAILRDDTCLVAQRGRQMSLPLAWEFPGGKVEEGESPVEALRREIAEEFGVEVEVHERMGAGTSEIDGHRIHLEVFRAEITAGTLTLHEHEAVRWVDVDEIEHLDWAEADLPLIPQVRAVMKRSESEASSASPRCPACGSADVREIDYRLVYDRRDFEAYHLGGCVMSGTRSHCDRCGHEW